MGKLKYQLFADQGSEAGTILLRWATQTFRGSVHQKILAYFGLSEEDLAVSGSITCRSNVKEVTTQVSEAAVDCGIIYQTDVFRGAHDRRYRHGGNVRTSRISRGRHKRNIIGRPHRRFWNILPVRRRTLSYEYRL